MERLSQREELVYGNNAGPEVDLEDVGGVLSRDLPCILPVTLAHAPAAELMLCLHMSQATCMLPAVCMRSALVLVQFQYPLMCLILRFKHDGVPTTVWDAAVTKDFDGVALRSDAITVDLSGSCISHASCTLTQLMPI